MYTHAHSNKNDRVKACTVNIDLGFHVIIISSKYVSLSLQVKSKYGPKLSAFHKKLHRRMSRKSSVVGSQNVGGQTIIITVSTLGITGHLIFICMQFYFTMQLTSENTASSIIRKEQCKPSIDSCKHMCIFFTTLSIADISTKVLINTLYM